MKATARLLGECPTEDKLRSFDLGHLSIDAIESIGQHLQGCETCVSYLDTLHESDHALAVLSSADHRRPLADLLKESEFQEMEARAKSMRMSERDETHAYHDWKTAASTLPERVGAYSVIREIGTGGFARVYLGRDGQNDRLVAIKVPRHDRLWSEAGLQAFLIEARTLASLDHPQIVPIYDWGRIGQTNCFVALKYIEGQSLRDVIATGKLNPIRAVQVAAAVAEALQYAHKLGFVHRDIKPANVLLDQSGNSYVTDFGLAIHNDHRWAHRGELADTRPYMAPEQIRSESHRLDGRTDIWSLGVMLYEMLTAQRPFKDLSDDQLDDEIQFREPIPPRQIDETIPAELERICLRCLSKRMMDRYSTCFDLTRDLREFLSDADVNQRSVPSRAAAATKDGAILTLENPALRVVPKGLRCFDQDDADFFLALAPGPRDRYKIPDSVRFWKTRIEERDGNKSFPVGVIYGPSGCGKSSLVRAGLLSQLTNDVITVYVEASGKNLDARILHGLRRRLADMPRDRDLKDSLAALRQAGRISSQKKVLVAIDQFEQWLHGVDATEYATLVAALRQCDGSRLQCLLLVRDEFWLALSRLARDLEITFVEGHNSLLVDLLDVGHASKVLTAFGQAYGRLPTDLAQITSEQTAFLTDSVNAIADDGKISCVRLALFAEMMKDKIWTPKNLRRLGGVEGVGTAFLDDRFASATAPPAYRLHQRAARAVLQSLLPELGADIRGHMRSYPELMQASGYASPLQFDELLQILDMDTRLITPCDRADPAVDEADNNRLASQERYYQLTHDYLVPSLRSWLTRQQKETRRGRAELCLADQTAMWNSKRDNRHLPTWWEWLRIRLFTNSKEWTEPQQTMMRQMDRYLTVRGLALAGGLALLLLAGWESFGRWRAQSLQEQLWNAPMQHVPAVVEEMEGYRRWLDVPLQQVLAQAQRSRDAHKQLRVNLALLPADHGRADYLLAQLLVASPPELVAIRTVMEPQARAVSGRLWAILENPKADPNQRLRAACFLANYEPGDRRWNSVSGDVAARLMTENALLLKAWAELLRPVKRAMLPSLANLVAQSRSANEQRRSAELYAEFAADVENGWRPLQDVLSEGTDDEPLLQLTSARRKANAAAALAIAGRWDQVWPLLRQSPDPTVRTYLMERLGTVGIESREIIDRLIAEQESDLPVRRALLLVLGDLREDQLPAHARQALLNQLLKTYQEEPDSSLRAMAGWLLRRWRREPTGHANDRDPNQEFVVVLPGEIEVRDETGQPRNLRVGRRFALGCAEVTIAQYLRFRSDHTWDKRSAPSHDCPVNEVSWYDAAAYCNWLSQEAGIAPDQWCYAPNDHGEYAAGMKVKSAALRLSGYRLPTTTEWEFACRAGSATYWSMGSGEDMLGRYAWFMANAGLSSHPVGSLRPNDLGLFDMHGNVWEWCHDRIDGQGAQAASELEVDEAVDDDTYRPLRGGTYLNDANGVGSATGNWNRAIHHTGADGFRVARTLPE